MSDEIDRAIDAVDDSIFEFMRQRPLHPLTQKLVPQIKQNLKDFGEPFLIVGDRNERTEAAEAAIEVLNQEKSHGL